MYGRKADLAIKYNIAADRLYCYEKAGILKSIHLNGETFYADIRVAVIAKGEELGFSLEEIRQLIISIAGRAVGTGDCPDCQGHDGDGM